MGMLITWFIVAPLYWVGRCMMQKVWRYVSGFSTSASSVCLFLYVYQMRNALLVGTNQSKYLIIGTATEAVTNVFFDYSLIYGKFGMPQMGFDGAAYASIISEFAGLAVIFVVIRMNGITKQLQLFKNWAYDAANVKLILNQSYPLILQHTISIMSWEFFYILIEHHGKADLAISNTMRNIFGFFGCFTWAFAATANTMVSNVIGQNLQHKVPTLINKIMYWSVGFALLVCIFLNVSAPVLSIYGQGEDFIPLPYQPCGLYHSAWC
jgi:MATE family multidrug resistance protein